MKSALTLLLLALPLMAAEPAWPARLLVRPFHVGDTPNRKDMRNPKADGASFTATFDLPENIRPGVSAVAWLTVRATGLIAGSDKRMKSPSGPARIFLNEVEIGDLNKLSRGDGKAGTIERQQFRIPGTALRATGNKLEIRCGATASNLLDFELHEVVVASTPL